MRQNVEIYHSMQVFRFMYGRLVLTKRTPCFTCLILLPIHPSHLFVCGCFIIIIIIIVIVIIIIIIVIIVIIIIIIIKKNSEKCACH